MTMITPSYLGETIEYSSLHACRSTLEDPTGLVITKLDGTAKGGVVLAIAQRLKIPIRFIGVGEQSEDFGVFNASEFVSALLKTEPRDAAA